MTNEEAIAYYYNLKGDELQAALTARDRSKTCDTCAHQEQDELNGIPAECMKCGWAFRTNWQAIEPNQLTLF